MKSTNKKHDEVFFANPDLNIKTIDCGIGKIYYLQPDNLKLQILMDEFKEKQERILYQKP